MRRAGARVRGAALVLGGLLAAGSALAGTEVRTETRESERPDRVRPGRALFDGPRLRVETDDGRRTIIYRADRGRAWVLDHKRKTYIEVEKPTADAVARQAREYLDALPPEQGEALARTLGAGTEAARGVEVRETDTVDEVGGISCRVVQVHSGAERLADVCRATYSDAGVDPASFSGVRDLQALLGGSLAAFIPRDSRDEGLAALESFAELDGVPLRVRAYKDGQVDSTTVVKSIRSAPLPSSSFEVPDGYRPKISINIR